MRTDSTGPAQQGESPTGRVSARKPNYDHYHEEDQPRYVISVAAQILGVHPQTLRLYEREGLVEPKRTGGKIRLYSERDIEQVRSIMRLTNDLGVNLAGAEAILNMRQRMLELHREMERVRSEMNAMLDELRRELDV